LEKLKVSQVAQSLRVSNQTVYNYLSKFRQDLEGHLIRETGKQYLTQEGFKILKSRLGTPDPIETFKGSQNLESLIVGLKDTIDTLIRQHAEERVAAAEERRRSDTIIMKLTNDVGSLQKQLEYRGPEVRPTDPIEGKPLPVVVSVPTMPIRAEVPRKVKDVVVKPQVQRELSGWESLSVFFDDLAGFVLGRG
jgi:hypothetical protein